jgi:hypothetical protein
MVYCADRYHSGVVRYGPDKVEIARERDTFNHEIFRFNIGKSIGLAHVIEVIGDSRPVDHTTTATTASLDDRCRQLRCADGGPGGWIGKAGTIGC